MEASATVDHFEFKLIPGHRGGETFAEMAYTFEVDGEAYQGERICFGPATSKTMPDSAKAGKQITIHYQPSNPSNCVWRKGPTGRNQGLMIAGLVVACLGIVTGLATLRSALS